MNALEALRQNDLNAQQQNALRRPITRGSGTVFLARDNHERYALSLVADRGIVDPHLLSIRHVNSPAAFSARRELVPQTNVGERAPYHHFMVAAPGSIRIEILRLHSMRDKVAFGQDIYRE